jgi:hypothetical protein
LVNALFNAERHLVETFEAAESSGNLNFMVILDFSLGKLTSSQAHEVMQALGIDGEEDLFLLMAEAHLPMPRLPDPVTRGMVALLSGKNANRFNWLLMEVLSELESLPGKAC